MGGMDATILGDWDEVGVVYLLKLLTGFCLFALLQVNKSQLQVAGTQHRTVPSSIQSTERYHSMMNITHCMYSSNAWMYTHRDGHTPVGVL